MQRRHSQRSDSDSNLPALAPRTTSQTTQSSRDRDSPRQPGSSRPKSSHRSRAGCWTCRTRKVKCDEVHPRCGQCVRLNKTCDWEQRWKFDDSTRSTQEKFGNVNTVGNAVWDPSAARGSAIPGPSSSRHDSLPSFADLTTDEDRERKAESKAPGTFNVIINPGSFASMPEYAQPEPSRRPSAQSNPGIAATGSPAESGRLALPGDPNTIVLTRFEDSNPQSSALLSPSDAQDTQQGLPGDMTRLDISSAGPEYPTLSTSLSSGTPPYSDQYLFRHYEQFISPRLFPLSQHVYDASIPDPIVREGRTFAPLHHAICAISLLSLYYKGHARWEDALEREGTATRLLARSVTSDDDLNSDGILFLHFLLLACDICNPIDDDNMWEGHLLQLKRILANRFRYGLDTTDVSRHILGGTAWLESQATLAGMNVGASSTAKFSTDLKPDAAESFIEPMRPGTPFHQQEVELLGPISRFTRRMVKLTSQLTQLVRQFRLDQGFNEGRQSLVRSIRQAIARYQIEMWQTWDESFPTALPRDDATAGHMLTPRCRHYFETGCLLHCINVIYSSACMYPGQLLSDATLAPKVALQCRFVIALAHGIVDDTLYARTPLPFALFLAGVCSPEAELKSAIMRFYDRYDGASIGRNPAKAKALLDAVIEEQQGAMLQGNRAEEVDWIIVAKQHGLELIDFGF